MRLYEYKIKQLREREEALQVRLMYHGTDAKFDIFDPAKQRESGDWFKGFYFTKDLATAKNYGKNIEARYIALENPLKLKIDIINPDRTVTYQKDARQQVYDLYPETRNMRDWEVSNFLQKQGYDGIRFGDDDVVFDVNKIKTKSQLLISKGVK